MKNPQAQPIQTTSDGTSANLEAKQTKKATKIEDIVFDNYQDFVSAYGEAVMEGIDHLTVSKRLFEFICKDRRTKSMTYGKPGIDVFVEGTRDAVLDDREMSADHFYERHIKERQEQAKQEKRNR